MAMKKATAVLISYGGWLTRTFPFGLAKSN